MKAGELRERLAFEKRVMLAEPGNGSGTKRGDWQQQFIVWAKVIFLRGGESVLASRLSGVQPTVITVRASSQSRLIKSDWRARDTRTGAIYNLKAPNPSANNESIDFIAETGGAIG